MIHCSALRAGSRTGVGTGLLYMSRSTSERPDGRIRGGDRVCRRSRRRGGLAYAGARRALTKQGA